MRGVDDAFGGVGVEGGVVFAEDGKRGAFFGGGWGGVRREGDEERGVVVEGVGGGRHTRYAEPGGEGREGVGAPVGVLGGEGGRGDDGAEVVPGGDELGGLLWGEGLVDVCVYVVHMHACMRRKRRKETPLTSVAKTGTSPCTSSNVSL